MASIAVLVAAIFAASFLLGFFLNQPPTTHSIETTVGDAVLEDTPSAEGVGNPSVPAGSSIPSGNSTLNNGNPGSSSAGRAGTEHSSPGGMVGGKGYVVCLDPGHAATPSQIDPDTGLNTQDWSNEPEIQIVYDIAVRTKAILETRGVTVVMTKKSVYDAVNLKQRAQVANNAGAAMIVHIHTDPGITNPTTFYPGAAPYNWKANSQSGRTAYIDPEVQRRSESMAKTFHSAMSSTLSNLTGCSRGSVTMENRGATGTGNYGPLLSYDVWSRVPTFTLENNQSFANSHHDEIARAIAEGILACLKP